MSEQRAALCVCGNGGEWYADNNNGEGARWYCGECEDKRAEMYGCALIVAEGCTHDLKEDEYCPCGCNGSGVFADDYDPCSKCGDEWAETKDIAGLPLCEQCYNTWKCGCGTGCESCKEAE